MNYGSTGISGVVPPEGEEYNTPFSGYGFMGSKDPMGNIWNQRIPLVSTFGATQPSGPQSATPPRAPRSQSGTTSPMGQGGDSGLEDFMRKALALLFPKQTVEQASGTPQSIKQAAQLPLWKRIQAP